MSPTTYCRCCWRCWRSSCCCSPQSRSSRDAGARIVGSILACKRRWWWSMGLFAPEFDFLWSLYIILAIQALDLLSAPRGADLDRRDDRHRGRVLDDDDGPRAGPGDSAQLDAPSATFWCRSRASSRQAEVARNESAALLHDLQTAHAQLQDYAARAEELSAVRERNRVARELHDSVNQSIFSITLTAEAARTMLDRDPARVPPYLNQLQDMTTSALAQLRSLIGQLRPKKRVSRGEACAREVQSIGSPPISITSNGRSHWRMPRPTSRYISSRRSSSSVSPSLSREKDRLSRLTSQIYLRLDVPSVNCAYSEGAIQDRGRPAMTESRLWETAAIDHAIEIRDNAYGTSTLPLLRTCVGLARRSPARRFCREGRSGGAGRSAA